MGEELTRTRMRMAVLEEESKYSSELRKTLEEVTQEYEAYR